MSGEQQQQQKKNCLKGFVCIQFCIQSKAGLIVRSAKEHLQNDNEQINDCNLLFPACNLQLFFFIHNAQNCPGYNKNEKLRLHSSSAE